LHCIIQSFWFGASQFQDFLFPEQAGRIGDQLKEIQQNDSVENCGA